MNKKNSNDSIVLAETIQDNAETMDIYLMALATLVNRIKEVDENNKLKHITDRLGTLHDLMLDKIEDLEILQDSIRYRVAVDMETISHDNHL